MSFWWNLVICITCFLCIPKVSLSYCLIIAKVYITLNHTYIILFIWTFIWRNEGQEKIIKSWSDYPIRATLMPNYIFHGMLSWFYIFFFGKINYALLHLATYFGCLWFLRSKIIVALNCTLALWNSVEPREIEVLWNFTI